ncbi:alpha/beta hydrolase [Streptomyces olivoreticuli]
MSRSISAFAAEEERRVLSMEPVTAPVHRAYGDHSDQVYDLWPADDPHAPLVILLHGGFWRYDRTHLTPFAAHLAENGFTTALPEFRRPGGAGGYPVTFDDVALAMNTIADGRPFLLAGHSSGGHLALWAAARGLLPDRSPWYSTDLPAAVLALAPITDLAGAIREDLSSGAALELLGGADKAPGRLPSVDPLTLLRGAGTTGVPTVVLHGSVDEEIPHQQFTDYAAVHPDAELIALPGVGHYTPIEPHSPAGRTVIATLDRLSAHVS